MSKLLYSNLHYKYYLLYITLMIYSQRLLAYEGGSKQTKYLSPCRLQYICTLFA